MSNPFFHFKQFSIYQDQCALKVCTDACILGAWFAAKIPDDGKVLDIGSGTGLLMLMLAQKSEAEIEGIEIDLPSFKQLKENITASKWKDRLKVVPGDVRNYKFPEKFDFIISNPPFFEKDLLSVAAAEQIAKHSKELTLEELLTVIDQNLLPHGSFGVLLPYHRLDYFHSMATQNGFFLVEKLVVKQTPEHSPFRVLLHYSRNRETFVASDELVIKESSNQYTPEFIELLKDYYLKL